MAASYRKQEMKKPTWIAAGLLIFTALTIAIFLGMERSNYLAVGTTTSFIAANKSSVADNLGIMFNISFPALSCEFASVDVINPFAMNSLNITEAIHKFPIDSNLHPTGPEFHSAQATMDIKHDEEDEGGSISLNAQTFDKVAHQHDILVVNFYFPGSFWWEKSKPSWEMVARMLIEKYGPKVDGRIVLVKVDCSIEPDLCKRHSINGYPSIRIFRKGSDIREMYYGQKDIYSLAMFVEELVASVPLVKDHTFPAAAHNTSNLNEPAPSNKGCRIEGYLKEVPRYLIFSGRSPSHSFYLSKMNMSHVISTLAFGGKFPPKATIELKRILPDSFGENYEALSGRAFITQPDLSDATIEHYIRTLKTEIVGHGHSMVEYGYVGYSHVEESLDIPVVRFHIRSSRKQFVVTKSVKSFPHLLAKVWAIVLVAFCILISILHNTLKWMRRKKTKANICEATIFQC